MKCALITGGTGFVGSNLAKRLYSDGWDIHVIVPTKENECSAVADIGAIATLHEHDMTTRRMEEIVVATKPDIVFHLASLFLAQHEPGQVEPLIRANVLFASQLLEAMKQNGIDKLVNTGTSWQHYNDAAYDPVCLYAATKQAFEAILTFYVETSSLNAVTLKLFDTYGPADLRPKLFHLLKNAVETGKTIEMSAGEQLIDLVFIDDVVEAFTVAAQRLAGGKISGHEIFAVTSGSPIRLRDLVELYGNLSGRLLKVAWGKRPYRPREVMRPWSKGRTLEGWSPKVGIHEGLEKILMELHATRAET